MKYEPKPGQALVIYGPQGSGKSLEARKLAQAAGEFSEIDSGELFSNFQHWLRAGVRTVVVEGLPTPTPKLKALITNETMVAHRKGKEAEAVRTPNFIFCTGDPQAVRLVANDRRFTVVTLAGGK